MDENEVKVEGEEVVEAPTEEAAPETVEEEAA
ncbi:MAG: hypothetical protein JWN64_337 [Parcubacteria group bacterium]|nr:hypothetical protein [Parcubacteria group bacterium]